MHIKCVGRLEGKRPLERPRHRWEDNIKMDFREVGYDDRDWINLAQDRDQWWAYVRAVMNLRIPEKPIEKKYFFGDHTITDWRQFIDEVVVEYIEVNSEKVGGDGKVVEIGESKFGRRKYNRGHFVEGQWDFGGVEKVNGDEVKGDFSLTGEAVTVILTSDPVIRDDFQLPVMTTRDLRYRAVLDQLNPRSRAVI
ncbi:hypothetical protein ANN_24354, partial [Periplaneta americana]